LEHLIGGGGGGGDIGQGITPPVYAYFTIDLKNNNVCAQYQGNPPGTPTSFPNLQAPDGKHAGDSIVWHTQVAGQKVVVQFPQGAESDPGTPFEIAVTGRRRTDFGAGDDSGPAHVDDSAYVNGIKQFPFYGVMVDGQQCSNPQSMGVQVTK
ncbi:MAG: hypothetical protein WBS19_20430, partial [Candidatus Korobacteraceae bacterium]